MIRGYHIGATDEVIPYPRAERPDSDPEQLQEDDIEMQAQSGRVYVDKLSSRRQWILPFRVPESQLQFFRDQHNAVGGRESAFYFVLDVDGSPIESLLVRKEKEFRFRCIGRFGFQGQLVKWYDYTQTLTEDKDNEYSIEE